MRQGAVRVVTVPAEITARRGEPPRARRWWRHAPVAPVQWGARHPGATAGLDSEGTFQLCVGESQQAGLSAPAAALQNGHCTLPTCKQKPEAAPALRLSKVSRIEALQPQGFRFFERASRARRGR